MPQSNESRETTAFRVKAWNFYKDIGVQNAGEFQQAWLPLTSSPKTSSGNAGPLVLLDASALLMFMNHFSTYWSKCRSGGVLVGSCSVSGMSAENL
jgi:hypothetical protein